MIQQKIRQFIFDNNLVKSGVFISDLLLLTGNRSKYFQIEFWTILCSFTIIRKSTVRKKIADIMQFPP